MGQFKKYMMECEDRGYSRPKDTYVCAEMFPYQYFIRVYITKNGKPGVCDYCGKQTQVSPLENIVELVVGAFNKIYEDPAENLPFESKGDDDWDGTGLHKEGGGCILPKGKHILSTEEALEGCGFMPDSDELFEDIASCFVSDCWVVKDAFVGTEDEQLASTWQQFWDETIDASKKDVPYHDIYNRYTRLLTYLSDVIGENLSSISTILPKDTLLYRCVNYNPVPTPLQAANLWAPPFQFATSQRMSRQGQSRFYASFDAKTPLAEAVSGGAGQYHCLGTFQLSKDVRVLDFTSIPHPYILNVPNYFAFRFFYGFQDAITHPVGTTAHEKHKYVPTQIMRDLIETDFMRAGIMGIKYRSVKHGGCANVVLFLDDTTCGSCMRLYKSEVVA